MKTNMKRSRAGNEDGLSSNCILDIVKEIASYKGTEKQKREHFEKQYPEFASRYSYLFIMACEDNFDIERLQYMLHMRENIHKQHVTLEDASVEVGQKMFDVYIKDNLPPVHDA